MLLLTYFPWLCRLRASDVHQEQSPCVLDAVDDHFVERDGLDRGVVEVGMGTELNGCLDRIGSRSSRILRELVPGPAISWVRCHQDDGEIEPESLRPVLLVVADLVRVAD